MQKFKIGDIVYVNNVRYTLTIAEQYSSGVIWYVKENDNVIFLEKDLLRETKLHKVLS